jgi:hypothetical protein
VHHIPLRLGWTIAVCIAVGAAEPGFVFAQGAHAQPFAAKGKAHWAFQKLGRPDVPRVKANNIVRTPVDAFVLHRLEARRLTMSPEADRRTLVRRAYLDLIGLPPSPDQVDAFLNDRRSGAYEQMVDRLLASPQFGERWGRHWLDAAGYTDVTGTDNDAATVKLAENRWLYRDYVVRAINEDRPLQRFLHEQLAGDELVDWRAAERFTPQMRELLVATGFLRTAADDTDEIELNTLDVRYSVLHRTIETVASNLLAMTLGCARCHDHKYEPIAQADYYRFQALFQPTLDPQHWKQPKDRQVAAVGAEEKAEIERGNAELQKRTDQLSKRKAAVKDKGELAALDGEIAKLNVRRRKWESLQAVYDVGPPTPTRLLKRGAFDRPAAVIAPGFLSVLSAAGDEQRVASTSPAGRTSGRRLALAQWLTDAKTPAGALVLRVRVNRVWQQLFGRGLVETSDNLGLTGAAPTHPELLEWLVAEFDARGQRLKPFLKLLMTSAVYRQASAGGMATSRSADPENRLLGGMPLRRLEAEVIRDCILSVSGTLDLQAGGPPVPVESRPDGTFVVRSQGTPTTAQRRSIYLLSRRNYHETLLGTFDVPNLTTGCARRSTSAVVGQALTMLNGPFVLAQAGVLAERVAKAADSTDRRIGEAFTRVLCRPPTEREMLLSRALLAKQTAHYCNAGQPQRQAEQRAVTHLCHMLLNTSEFLYSP